MAVSLFLIALGITLYPLISTAYNSRHQSLIHTQYTQELANTDAQFLQQNRELAVQYNTALVPGAQQVDAFSSAAVELASVDYANLLNIAGNGIMGYLLIPQIGAELPIYHGTSDATLEVGVGHLLGSSLPVGGASTHTVLTGHSGMANNKMLSDLDQLEIGDVFYLEVLEETLAYQVDQIKTVLPSDTTYLGIEEASDYCTLVTCTPFWSGGPGFRTRRKRKRKPFLCQRTSPFPPGNSSTSEEFCWGSASPALCVLPGFW